MPGYCPSDIPRLTSQQFGSLDYRLSRPPLRFITLDLVVDELGIYELKKVDSINKAHIGQVSNYLRLLNAARANIINSRNHVVESKFVDCSDTLVQRRILKLTEVGIEDHPR